MVVRALYEREVLAAGVVQGLREQEEAQEAAAAAVVVVVQELHGQVEEEEV